MVMHIIYISQYQQMYIYTHWFNVGFCCFNLLF